jgi:hypothetical protein
MRSGRQKLGPALLGVFASFLLLPAGGALAAGSCVSTDLPAPVVLPDGSVNDAGQIRICLSQNLSPVSVIHKTYLDGYATGMLMSRKIRTEGDSEVRSPYFVFEKSSDEGLRLIAYARSEGNRMATYVFAEPTPLPRSPLTATKKQRSRQNRYSFANNLDSESFMIAAAR